MEHGFIIQLTTNGIKEDKPMKTMKKDYSISDIEKVLNEKPEIIELFKIVKGNPVLIKKAIELTKKISQEKELLDDLMLEQQDAF